MIILSSMKILTSRSFLPGFKNEADDTCGIFEFANKNTTGVSVDMSLLVDALERKTKNMLPWFHQTSPKTSHFP